MSRCGYAKNCRLGLCDVLEEAGDDPFGHAPDYSVLQGVGLYQAGIPGHFEADRVMGSGLQQVVDRDPGGSGYFGIELQRRAGRDEEDERPDGYRRQHRRTRHYIVQGPGQSGRIQLDTDLLRGFPDCGGQQLLACRGAAASRQSHVSAPGISGTLGPADEQKTIGLRSEDDSHRGPEEGCVVVDAGLVSGQPLAQADKPAGQCECDW